MAQRRKSGGGGGPAKTVIWWAVVAMIVLAAWRGIGAEDGKSFLQWFQDLAGQTEETFTEVGNDVKDAIPKGSDKPVEPPSDGASGDTGAGSDEPSPSAD